MHANNIVRLLLCFRLVSAATGQVIEDLFSAQVSSAQLLGDKSLVNPRSVLTSLVLGNTVLDLAPLVRESGVNLLDSDIVLYGPDVRLMYLKSDLKSINEIKTLFQTTKKSKSVYKVKVDKIDKNEFSKKSPIFKLDVTVLSGEPVRIKLGENPVTEVVLTEGVVSTGETQFEIKFSGLGALIKEKIPDAFSCNVKLAAAGVLYNYPLEESPNSFLRIRLDRVMLDDNPEFQDRRSIEQEQILSVVRSELKEIKK